VNVILFILAALALAGIQVLQGGWHPVLSLPGYALLALAALVSWCRGWRMPIPSRAAEPLAAGALFFLYVVGRALFSPEEYLARNDLFMALAAMALYLLVALNLTSSTWRGWFIGCLLLLGVANCLVGAIQFTRGQNFVALDFLDRSNYGSRASGFYGYPNHLALFLEVCILMGFSVAIWSRWRPWVKVLAGYASLLCVVGLLFTGSRGGYMGALAGALVFGLLSLRLVGEFARTKAIALLAVGGLTFVVLGFGVQHLLTRSSLLQERMDQKVTSRDIRVELWKTAWRQFKLQPVAGTGSGTYLYYGRQFSTPAVDSDPGHAHNEYLEMLAEYGILGIAAALMFLDSHFRGGWRWITRQIAVQSRSESVGGNSLAMTVGAMSATAACLVHSGTDFTLHMPANMLTMAFVFGLLANPGGAREGVPADDVASEDRLPSWIRLALPALGLWLAIRALPTWPAEFFSFKARAITADWRYMESPELAQAMEDFARRGLRWDPRNPHLYRYAGVAETALSTQATDPAVQKKWSDMSAASYEAGATLAPRNILLVLDLAWAYEAEERYAEADPFFKRAIELDPTSSDAHYAYASHLRNQGKLPEAAAEFQKSVTLGGGQSPQLALNETMAEIKAKGSPSPPDKLEQGR
jgi:O-antigen ligase